MKSKKTIIIIAALVVVITAVAALLASALVRDFDAEKYVSVVLNQTFKGDVKGATEEELMKQYEDGVTSFVKNNIINGVEVDAEREAQFIELGKKIFASMKYEVTGVEKISNEEYVVKVNYEASDVFLKYIQYIAEESGRITAKVEDGEYKGTVDEINAQMKADFINSAYTLLEQANTDMTYSEVQETEFVVKAGTEDLYQVNETELHNLMVKIMRLDEIQD